MAAKLSTAKTRRKVTARGTVTKIPAGQGNRFTCLSRLSRRELRELAKSASLPTGGDKLDLANRLAADDRIAISETTEAVVFDRPA